MRRIWRGCEGETEVFGELGWGNGSWEGREEAMRPEGLMGWVFLKGAKPVTRTLKY